jgi:hypothetical protein
MAGEDLLQFMASFTTEERLAFRRAFTVEERRAIDVKISSAAAKRYGLRIATGTE